MHIQSVRSVYSLWVCWDIMWLTERIGSNNNITIHPKEKRNRLHDNHQDCHVIVSNGHHHI